MRNHYISHINNLWINHISYSRSNKLSNKKRKKKKEETCEKGDVSDSSLVVAWIDKMETTWQLSFDIPYAYELADQDVGRAQPRNWQISNFDALPIKVLHVWTKVISMLLNMPDRSIWHRRPVPSPIFFF